MKPGRNQYLNNGWYEIMMKSNGDMVRGEDLTHFYKQLGFVRQFRR